MWIKVWVKVGDQNHQCVFLYCIIQPTKLINPGLTFIISCWLRFWHFLRLRAEQISIFLRFANQVGWWETKMNWCEIWCSIAQYCAVCFHQSFTLARKRKLTIWGVTNIDPKLTSVQNQSFRSCRVSSASANAGSMEHSQNTIIVNAFNSGRLTPWTLHRVYGNTWRKVIISYPFIALFGNSTFIIKRVTGYVCRVSIHVVLGHVFTCKIGVPEIDTTIKLFTKQAGWDTQKSQNHFFCFHQGLQNITLHCTLSTNFVLTNWSNEILCFGLQFM